MTDRRLREKRRSPLRQDEHTAVTMSAFDAGSDFRRQIQRPSSFVDAGPLHSPCPFGRIVLS